ncbi:MAG: acyl-CoA reductase [Flavobacteriales bacterium]|nr:acyl-CoA reductase [Flavobacteriales bacterium]
MNHQQRIAAFAALGKRLAEVAENPAESDWAAAFQQAEAKNGWFTQENMAIALRGIAYMLETEKLQKWLSAYGQMPEKGNKRVGLVMAGNIPLVGFHDLLCVLISGNTAVVKTSSQDEILPKKLVETIAEISPELALQIELSHGKLEGFTHVIATGSDNTARYFEYYFGKYPNIIRKNRNSIAIISGDESEDELRALGKDIFRYFGLGCRNVSKVYLSDKVEPKLLLNALEDWKPIGSHNKYWNNYEYHKAIFLVEKMAHLDNGFLLLREEASLGCPVGVLHYQTFSTLEQMHAEVKIHEKQIQCVVASDKLGFENSVPFGKAQSPELWDYADGVDTMVFLLGQ